VGLAEVKPANPIFDQTVMKPIQIDVFYPIPEGWAMCNACELMMAQANIAGAPETRASEELPQGLKDELQSLSNTIYELAEKFQNQVVIKVWDPRSLQGLLKSILYGVHRYPTFIVNGRGKFSGFDAVKLAQQVQSALESQISAL
jgi:hypothetical protein